jgi:hypothetical protein
MYQKVVMGLLNGVSPNDNLHSAKNKEGEDHVKKKEPD